MYHFPKKKTKKMTSINYFFERHEFIDVEIPKIVLNNSQKTQQKSAKIQHIAKPYYKYLGYFRENPVYKYPVSLYFGKDEVAINYVKEDGKILKVFSLYVAEGELNQNILGKKIEDYAFMPLWQLPGKLPEKKSEESKEIIVDPVLLNTGFFASYYGFKFEENCFEENNLLDIYAQKARIENDTKLIFGDEESENNQLDDTWEIKDEKIKVSKINFIKILLDFLFELDFANTFEDENFFRLQPHIQNNLVLDALTKKCRYIAELDKQRNFSRETRKSELPKPFLDAEKEWLNVCCLEDTKEVFASPKSLFLNREQEVWQVIFGAKIGKTGKKRRAFFSKEPSSTDLRNKVCSFFMRQYNVIAAYDVLLPSWTRVLLPVLLLLIPIGDLLLWRNPERTQLVGISTMLLPFLLTVSMVLYYYYQRLNLFKLLLPRLFLGIMLGWSAFWASEELWKKALTARPLSIVLFDCVILLMIGIYVYTDISNKLFKTKRYEMLKRSTVIIGVALIISFVQGFYVIQFYAEPMLENCRFLLLDNDKLFEFKKGALNTDEKYRLKKHPPVTLQDMIKKETETIRNDPWKKTFLKSNYYFLPFPDRFQFSDNDKRNKPQNGIVYIWSIIFSQLVVSVLIGIVLQLLWEDRPITEPL